MPSPGTLLLFSTAALVLLVIPGPSVLYITARSAAQGHRAGLISVLGIHTGTAVHVLAAAIGLSALVMASAVAFTVIRYIGAAYLIVLGIRTIIGQRARDVDEPLTHRSTRRLYLDGVVVNVLNPKTALFFLAFVPQFVDHARGPVWQQTLVLGALFVVLGFISDSAYALVGARLGLWYRTRRRGAARHDGRIEGGVLVSLGVAALVLPHPHPYRA